MSPLLLVTLLLLSLTHPCSAQIRINPRHFGMSEGEIRILLQATLQLFPPPENQQLPPLFISHHPDGPITLFERTPRGEIAIQLSSKNRYHAQFIYQFAHELTHIRCGLNPSQHQNKWLEESLCETASLFALRKLSSHWEKNAPNPTLQKYRTHLADYAQKVLNTRHHLTVSTAPAFYQKHRDALHQNPTNRPLNGAFTTLFLPHLEAHPRQWKHLIPLPQHQELSLTQFLNTWQNALPSHNHSLPKKIQDLLFPTQVHSK